MTVLEAWPYAKPVLMTPKCNLREGFAAGAALQIETSPETIAAGLKQLIEMSDDDRKPMAVVGALWLRRDFHGRALANRCARFMSGRSMAEPCQTA